MYSKQAAEISDSESLCKQCCKGTRKIFETKISYKPNYSENTCIFKQICPYLVVFGISKDNLSIMKKKVEILISKDVHILYYKYLRVMLSFSVKT